MFNPNRLKLARKRRRLSGKELAERVGLSYVTISRLETASNEPDPETVDAFARVLNFPREFFFGRDLDELNREFASFRSLTSMTAKERDSALSAGSLAYLLSDWVEHRFNLPQPDLLDLGTERDSAEAAISIRRHWGLGEKPVGNIIKLLEAKGVRVFSLAENTKNVDAFSCWRNGKPYIFLNTFKSVEHRRFDAAHELGHLVLHRHGGVSKGGRPEEAEANNFASSFLMPADDVTSRISFVSSLDQLVLLKQRWRVSVAALAYRLHKLGVLSDWQYRTFCIQMTQRGYRVSEPDGINPEESAVWGKVFSELWSERITKNHIAAELNIPMDEIENMVAGLIGTSQGSREVGSKKGLRLSSV